MQRLLDLDLTGHTAVVTGGSRGLGREVAATLTRAGAEVAIVARDSASLAHVSQELSGNGRPVHAVPADVSDPGDVEKLVSRLTDISPHWDILVNSAGMAHHQGFLEIDSDTWSQTLAVNLTGPFLLSQALGAVMAERGYGRIVNVSSHSGRRTGAGSTSYSVSKAALQMLTQCIAVELGPQGVRANAICPTIFLSDMGKELWGDPGVLAGKIAAVPAKRLGEMSEIADLILYLSSPAADFVNGSVIGIDGGLFAGRPAT